MTKFAGRDVVLSIDGTAITQATAIGEAGSTRDLIDASAYGDDDKDYVLGQKDGNEMELTLAYDPDEASHDDISDAFDDAVSHTFLMTHADSGMFLTFPALVTTFSRGGERDGLLQASATLKIVTPGVVGS